MTCTSVDYNILLVSCCRQVLMDNCAMTHFRLQLLGRLFPFILPKNFLPPTLNMKNEGRDAFFPLLLHLLFFSREKFKFGGFSLLLLLQT